MRLVIHESKSIPNPRSADYSRKTANHAHGSWEIKAPLNGLIYHRDSEKARLALKWPALLLVPPHALHCQTDLNNFSRGAQWMCFSFEQGTVGLVISGRTKPEYCFLSANQIAALSYLLMAPPIRVCEQVYNLYHSDHEELIKQTCDGLFIMLFTCLMQVIASGDRHLSPSELKVGHALSYIKNEYYDCCLSVRTIAAAIGLSSSHLAHLCCQETGLTVRQNLVKIRLEQAYNDLHTGRMSVKEVAFRTGWKNQLYFSTCFRKKYGFPPSRVRIQ